MYLASGCPSHIGRILYISVKLIVVGSRVASRNRSVQCIPAKPTSLHHGWLVKNADLGASGLFMVTWLNTFVRSGACGVDTGLTSAISISYHCRTEQGCMVPILIDCSPSPSNPCQLQRIPCRPVRTESRCHASRRCDHQPLPFPSHITTGHMHLPLVSLLPSDAVCPLANGLVPVRPISPQSFGFSLGAYVQP